VAVVTLRPETFTLIKFDAAEVRAVIASTADAVGLAADEPVTVNVDETISLGRIRLQSLSPIELHVESGAFEDTKRLRSFGPEQTAGELARVFLRIIDRRSGRFDDAPADDKLTLQQAIAWDVSAVGRAVAAGLPGHKPRRLYAFRNRHGFTDAVDIEFERLWTAREISWTDIVAVCDRTSAANVGASK
jgi:hypothetical protein